MTSTGGSRLRRTRLPLNDAGYTVGGVPAPTDLYDAESQCPLHTAI